MFAGNGAVLIFWPFVSIEVRSLGTTALSASLCYPLVHTLFYFEIWLSLSQLRLMMTEGKHEFYSEKEGRMSSVQDFFAPQWKYALDKIFWVEWSTAENQRTERRQLVWFYVLFLKTISLASASFPRFDEFLNFAGFLCTKLLCIGKEIGWNLQGKIAVKDICICLKLIGTTREYINFVCSSSKDFSGFNRSGF